MQTIIDTLITFRDFLYSLMMTAFFWIQELLYVLFETSLTMVSTAIQGLSSLFQTVASFSVATSGMPSEVAYVFMKAGIPQASVMIVSAITIRITLQLIPFTRLGS